jgi:hypothetical protein
MVSVLWYGRLVRWSGNFKIEEEVARIIFDRASREPKQIKTTLILIKDIYHGWAVDRIPGLLSEINIALDKIR